MLQPYDALIADNVFGYPQGTNVFIAIQHGCILGIEHPAGEAMAVLAAQDQVLDCRGKLLLPGLIDAHVHAIGTGMLLLTRSLREVASLAALAAEIADAAHESALIRLGAFDTSRWQQAELAGLDRKWLDGQAPAQPLMIKSVEGHSGWFNTAAWRLLGIAALLDHLGISAVERAEMERSGRVSGAAYEELVPAVYDSFTAEERRRGMQLVIAEAQRQGLTGMHCLEGYGARKREDFELILGLDDPARIDLTLYCRDETPALAVEMGVPRFGGCWCLDGAIGAHSAAVAEPYVDKPESCGTLFFSDAEISAWIESGLKHDLQICVHAIGERALIQAVNTYSALGDHYDLRRLRPRVDHFVLGTPELAVQAARLGLTSAMQPAFDAHWGGESGGYARRLGSARALRTNPVRTLLHCGLELAGSSDSYVTPLDPLAGIRAAMYHHNPEERLDFESAVSLFTFRAAYLAHAEAERGRIAPGYSADFTVVDGDRTLLGASAAATIKAGKAVFAKEY